jgi:uncharacterized protein (DUF1810 family)
VAYDLERFVAAQAPAYAGALAELRAGRKRSHWMWFVFPQLRGLGSSPTAQHFGIESLAEARAYLSHAVLGPRLTEAVDVVAASDAPSLRTLFGTPDDVKFISSATLFALAGGSEHSVFRTALARWNAGVLDRRTLELLRAN